MCVVVVSRCRIEGDSGCEIRDLRKARLGWSCWRVPAWKFFAVLAKARPKRERLNDRHCPPTQTRDTVHMSVHREEVLPSPRGCKVGDLLRVYVRPES